MKLLILLYEIKIPDLYAILVSLY